MNRKSTAEQVCSQLASADPATHITDHEMVRSRRRSLAVMQSVPVAVQEADGVDALSKVHLSSAPPELSAARYRRTRRWLTAAAAAGVVAALIGGDVVGLAGWRGGASAQAADFLNAAAQTSITAADPVVNPGQYLKIKSTNVWSTETVQEDGSSYQWLDTEKFEMYICT